MLLELLIQNKHIDFQPKFMQRLGKMCNLATE